MPTYCVPALSGVPGFPANQFNWWTLAADPASLRFYPENPNWLNAFSLSEGTGANRHLHFRALRGNVEGQDYLFLSWVMRVSGLSTAIDRVNVVLGDGTNYVALQIRLGTASGTVAGTQNANVYSYRLHSCSVDGGGAITQNNPALAVDGAALEGTGRMWVNVQSPQRLLLNRWAFQVAVPLGTGWAPSVLSLPASGAFRLWYEATASLPASEGAVPYLSTPSSPVTTNVLQVVPPGLNVSHLLDMSTGAAGCTAGVELTWGNVGTRNLDGTPRPTPTRIQVDLGKPYPPNSRPYDVNHTPNVAQPQFRNQFFARPTLPAGLGVPQQEALRARFSLANWGSQISIPTASSWRPIPGGEDVNFVAADGEMRFPWPSAGPGGTADGFTTGLVRNINHYLNAVGTGSPPQAGSQNPHQCVLVELTSTDPSVVITRSSIYQNMDVVQASVFRRFAEVSVVGLSPISVAPRDVYLYLQTFNMPPVVKGDQDGEGGDGPGDDVPPRDGQGAALAATVGRQRFEEVEDLTGRVPTYVVHAYHDTGMKLTLEDGRQIPILRPQTSFGYFAQHQGDLHGWETRIYGAEKIVENLYRVGVPNNGSVTIETAIQARESVAEPPLAPDGRRPTRPCTRLAEWLERQGIIGRLLAVIVRIVCSILGRA